MAFWTRLCAFALFICSTFAEIRLPRDNSSLYRLPKNVLPESYDLLLITDVTRGNFTYEGEIEVRLRVVERTKRVVLHAHESIDLLEERSRLTRLAESDDEVGVEDQRIGAQRYEVETQFYVVETEEDLMPGWYSLRLIFVGRVVDDLFGFYRSSYRTADGETRYE